MTVRTLSGNYGAEVGLDLWPGGGSCSLVVLEVSWGAPAPAAEES